MTGSLGELSAAGETALRLGLGDAIMARSGGVLVATDIIGMTFTSGSIVVTVTFNSAVDVSVLYTTAQAISAEPVALNAGTLRTVTLGAMSMTSLPADRASSNDADEAHERERFIAVMTAVLLSSLVWTMLWVSVRKCSNSVQQGRVSTEADDQDIVTATDDGRAMATRKPSLAQRGWAAPRLTSRQAGRNPVLASAAANGVWDRTDTRQSAPSGFSDLPGAVTDGYDEVHVGARSSVTAVDPFAGIGFVSPLPESVPKLSTAGRRGSVPLTAEPIHPSKSPNQITLASPSILPSKSRTSDGGNVRYPECDAIRRESTGLPLRESTDVNVRYPECDAIRRESMQLEALDIEDSVEYILSTDTGQRESLQLDALDSLSTDTGASGRTESDHLGGKPFHGDGDSQA